MQLFLGSYAFPANGVDVAIAITPTAFSAAGIPIRNLHRATCKGVIEGNNQAECTDAENALRLVLADKYRDLILYKDDSTASSTKLVNNTSLSGVRIVSGPIFANELRGAEHSTLRTFTFVAEAEYLVPVGNPDVMIAFSESLTMVGTGGPVTRYRNAINGPPVKQIVYPFSVVRATQSGQAVGHLRAPDPAIIAPPLWPADELVDQRVFGQASPEALGLAYVGYGVRWSYTFETAVGFFGFPNQAPLRS